MILFCFVSFFGAASHSSEFPCPAFILPSVGILGMRKHEPDIRGFLMNHCLVIDRNMREKGDGWETERKAEVRREEGGKWRERERQSYHNEKEGRCWMNRSKQTQSFIRNSSYSTINYLCIRKDPS